MMTASLKSVSPYVIGLPVPPERFYGRTSQISEFFRIMRSQTLQPLRVLGLRRSGKTSFLQYISQHQVYSAELDPFSRPTVIAYVDLLEDVTSPAKFFSAMAKSIEEAMNLRRMESDKLALEPKRSISVPEVSEQALKHAIAQTRQNLRLIQERMAEYVLSTDIPLQLKKEEVGLLERINELEQQLTAQAPLPNETATNRYKAAANEPLPSDFSAFKTWMQAILTADSKLQVIVLLDEFEVLTESPIFDQSFFGGMRALASGPSLSWRFTWVVASHTDLHLLNRRMGDSIKTSPLYNIFYPNPIILGGMESAEVEQLIRVPAQESGIPFSTEEVEAIKQLSGALPYFVQATANQWWQATQSAPIPFIDCRQKVLTQLIDGSCQVSIQLESYWRHLMNEDHAYISQVARAKSLASMNSIAEQKLVRFGLLCEKGGQIQVSGEVFQQWLERNLERLTAETTHAESGASPGSSTSS